MNSDVPANALQLRSLVKSSGELELSLASVPVKQPGPDQVLIKVEASPLNPSDLGLLLGAADYRTARRSSGGSSSQPVTTASIPATAMAGMAGRLDASMPVGNEGAGLVVATGSSDAAKALLGKRVAVLGGAMYSQYRTVAADQCMVLPEGATSSDGASAFVNPLTSLAMVDAMRREGHKALVHTAAASSLGQMLNRICKKDGIDLVNIVRKPEQRELLQSMGARYVCIAGTHTFEQELTAALVATGATIAFDATGGGTLAGQILNCMEAAINQASAAKGLPYSRYGSTTHKQVYVYGSLEAGPTVLNRNFGMAWSVGGFLIFPYLEKAGPATAAALKARVAAELTTTFKSHYAKELSLAEVLDPEVMAVYAKRATREKVLINPNR